MNFINISLTDFGQLFCESIPVGFLIGCFPMVIGVALHGLINILKRV